MGLAKGMRTRMGMGTGMRMVSGMGQGWRWGKAMLMLGKEALAGIDPCHRSHALQQSLWLGWGEVSPSHSSGVKKIHRRLLGGILCRNRCAETGGGGG